MKNLSVALMLLTTLSINLTPVRAVNKQVEINTNNELHFQENKITTSTNNSCFLKFQIPLFGMLWEFCI